MPLQVQWGDQVAADQVLWFRIQWVLQELRGKVMQADEVFKEQIQVAVEVEVLVVLEAMD
jgi:hypothetical protein